MIQFACGKVSSGVSSIVTIFQFDGINAVSAIAVVVLPEAVSPQIKVLIPSLNIIHM
ncbi:hypothetical protein MnTg01_00312 [archaeon MnTg01]|nr:hypothetical protein MnTg01_00312 [archaeon MnTg01]